MAGKGIGQRSDITRATGRVFVDLSAGRAADGVGGLSEVGFGGAVTRSGRGGCKQLDWHDRWLGTGRSSNRSTGSMGLVRENCGTRWITGGSRVGGARGCEGGGSAVCGCAERASGFTGSGSCWRRHRGPARLGADQAERPSAPSTWPTAQLSAQQGGPMGQSSLCQSSLPKLDQSSLCQSSLGQSSPCQSPHTYHYKAQQ